MTGFEEVHPPEGMWAPLQMRQELRQMFGRWLPKSSYQRPIAGPEDIIDELSILDLCQHYRLEYRGGAEDVAKSWDESKRRAADSGPTFDDLKNNGWVSFDGGRWIMQSAPLGTRSHITYPSPSTENLLTGLGELQLVARSDTPPPHAKALADRILADCGLPVHIPTKDPDWLAGRLWERLCPKPQQHSADDGVSTADAAPPVEREACDALALLDADAETVDRAFLEWSVWCDVLGYYGSWDSGWGPTEMRYSREAAHRALERQTLWGTWDNDAERYAALLKNTFAIPLDQMRNAGAPEVAPPRTLVSRVDWMMRPDVEHLIMERLGSNTASFAFALLCSELEKTDIGPTIMAAATTVLSFAAAHPMALQHLLFRVRSVPVLLVDMLMHQRTGCLAAKLAIEWRPKSTRSSDRNLSREAQTKAFAVQDALSLLAYHLSEGTLDLAEYASLVTWCYASDTYSKRAIADARRPVGRQLLKVASRQSKDLQSAVLQHLVDQADYTDNVPRACFAAVLDGLNYLSSAPISDAFPVVGLYSKFARDMHLEWTDAASLSANLAVHLVTAAFAHTASYRDALLTPFDSAQLLRNTPVEERPSLRYSIARTLRVHVRLLARAVAGWDGETVPPELCDALQVLISRSVIEHDQKGRVGALTDRYRPGPLLKREEASPAEDLAAAWRQLNGNHQEAMLQALALSDDPVLLAELCQHLPAAAKPGIRARLRQLKPEEASAFWTWPELQHRIESLLVAGEYALAREHLDEAEQDLDRAPSEFRLELFALELRLFLKEKNWAALDGAVAPLALDRLTAQQAQDKLEFYRATSQLLRPDGNLAAARVALERLAARPGAPPAYKENVFAVAIQQLVGPTLHPLSGADRVTGQGLLAEINAEVAVGESSVSSSLLANRALLMMALQKPEDALESVATRRRERRSPELELIAVLSKYELGFRDEAMAILDTAISEFGTDDRLIALKNDLQAGDSAPSIASASVVLDSISSIRAALQQLTVLLPSQIGDILGPPGGGVRGYLIGQVSRAVAALQHMAAMLRERKDSMNLARFEDDLNTAMREVLGALLAVTKWDVADQSLGGATANGNPGERDAVIRVSGQEISIIEALVCTGLDRTNIKKHFDKLVSYGVCDLYFHVIYSYAKELNPLFKYVGEMLEHEAPSGLIYLDCEPLGPPNYEASGYVATYRVDHREVAVAFLIVDLGRP
ncbi:hypothetical protein [Pseudomonas sp. BP8]|uniref:hypothetical protein n=1 Tax=Pseudomonas sp. BP8 TaxID=2817864 RepID=UPI001AE33DA2|nr:hypothetical protein [Pseudomonas sp. BP8]MBP2259660.1 hypothetical protein [Pseudomonas sp. BP8]HDS1733674.1 hypothetical protein [Pseudomonas putida]